MKRILSTLAILFLFTSTAYCQTNGKLQMHFIDVGQADAAVLISPKGEVVMFDNGVSGHCTLPVSYLEQLGITKIDYHIASHYHDDHIGCTTDVLDRFPLQKTAYDRGSSYSTQSYNKYVTAIGNKRKTVTVGEKIILDSTEVNPVSIEFVTANGAGVNTTNENDLSVVAVVRFGTLDLVMGGDLSGFKDGSYEDIETPIANSVGQVEVYKVHHHGSAYSSNNYWLSVIKPKVGVISAGNGNSYNHPTLTCLDRLHNAGVKTYWTENGSGVAANPQWDLIGGNIIVEAAPSSDRFTVAYNNRSQTDTYPTWNAKALSVNSYSPSDTTCAAGGCNGTVTVGLLPGDSAWSATSNDSWITVMSGTSGTGNGIVGYSVAANSALSRTGTITIGGQTFTITQASANAYFDTVQKIYIGYYQRPADPAGLIYWAERLDASGGNLTAIIEAYANSAESQALYGTINSGNISTVVNGIYNALFGRDAETEGLNYYANGFNSGQFTPATIMLNVLYGAQNEDLQSVNNKLSAANLFTRTIDPELDGSNFQATYAGNPDAIADRNFLSLYATSVKVPTQAETTAYIKANIADPGDGILTP
jgi:beta-lactamase superfamily II metal-dependent hydrolase